MSRKTKMLVGTVIGVLIVILIISTISMRTNSNIDTSNLEKLGTFVTLKQEDDGRYYGVDIFSSTKQGPKVYEFNDGYLVQKDDDNINTEDSYNVSVIDKSTFIVTYGNGLVDTTLTVVNYDSSTGVLELNDGKDIIYCYPYDYVDLESKTRESDSKYFSYKNYKYYVSLK